MSSDFHYTLLDEGRALSWIFLGSSMSFEGGVKSSIPALVVPENVDL